MFYLKLDQLKEINLLQKCFYKSPLYSHEKFKASKNRKMREKFFTLFAPKIKHWNDAEMFGILFNVNPKSDFVKIRLNYVKFGYVRSDKK